MRQVYFIKPIGMDGPIKIGIANNPHKRCRLLENGSPVRLEVVASMPGDVGLERRFHTAFVEDHVRCEWFTLTPALAAVIAQVRDGTFDIATLPTQAVRVDRMVNGKTAKVRRFMATYRPLPADKSAA